MSGEILAMLVGATAALFLAWRGLQSHALSFEKKAMMGVAWIAIIALVAFAIDRYAG